MTPELLAASELAARIAVNKAEFDVFKAVTEADIGAKTIPLLHFPDGSFIHLMPEKLPDGYQNPVHVLRQWLSAWMS
jgi:hypothetical protein